MQQGHEQQAASGSAGHDEESRQRLREYHLGIDLCLRVGELLLSSGAGAADVSATMQAVAYQLGMSYVEVDVTFTSLAVSYQHSPEEPPIVLIRQVKHRELDYADLAAVDQLVRDLVAGRTDLWLARTRMATITSTPHPLPRWAVTVAWGVMCSSVSVFLGGRPIVAGVAFVAAMAIHELQQLMNRRRFPGFYQQVVGGLVATLFAAGLAGVRVDVNSSLVISATILMLLAGIGFMGALQDALTGYYVTSGARLLEALLLTSGIIAGVSGGLSLAAVAGVEFGRIQPGAVGLEQFPILVLGSALCAAAFAVATYAPSRTLLPVALVSGVAVAVSQLAGSELELARPWAVGVAALLIGLVAYGVAGRARVPPLVVVVPAIVPMLPGLLIYSALSLLAEGGQTNISRGLLDMITALSVAMGLAAGVLLGEYLAQPVRREARRVETRLAGPRLVGPLRIRPPRRRRRQPAGSEQDASAGPSGGRAASWRRRVRRRPGTSPPAS